MESLWFLCLSLWLYDKFKSYRLVISIRGRHKNHKDSIKVTWWIIQNTYSEENTFFLKWPQKAIGGSFWNYENRYVRTDSVCHAVNAYVGIINDLEDGLLLSIPEEPFGAILRELKKWRYSISLPLDWICICITIDIMGRIVYCSYT